MTGPVTSDPGALRVRGLHKSFGSVRALRGVDLDVPDGRLTAVLGASGCGKTTLLRILAGFETADAGRVDRGERTLVDGRSAVPPERRRIGLVPQEGALFPHLDVAGNVAFGLTGRSRAARAAAVAHWLEVVGLPGTAAVRPHELSGGQQQRVALARALAAEPDVILLDEPFAALDATLRTRVREEIAGILADAGTTAVLVTHDQAEALSLADRVALLDAGVVAQSGTPDELYQRPCTATVARFLGETVTLSGHSTGQVVRTVLGRSPARLPVPDGPVQVVLRPEQLALDDRDGTPATVVGHRFYGATSTVHVRTADGFVLGLRTRATPALTPGTEVGVQVLGDVLAYADGVEPEPTGPRLTERVAPVRG